MKKIILTIVFSVFFIPTLAGAAVDYYVASNIPVTIDGAPTFDARDQALAMAQKLALDQFVAPEKADKVSTISLARAMKDFSLQNEHVLSQSYQARFTVRFDPVRFETLLRSSNLPLPANRQIDLTNYQPPTPIAETAVNEGDAVNAMASPTPSAAAPTIVVIPVLNNGNKPAIWDETNAWRDAWQQQHGFAMPLGDVADVTDMPDLNVLKQKSEPPIGLGNMLKRYNAQSLYIAVAQNATMGKGLTVKLYRYRDDALDYKGQFDPTSRPGYLFNDAATATVTQINRIENGQSLPSTIVKEEPAAATPSVVPTVPARSGGLVAIVPITSISNWIPIQQQLRQTIGVSELITQSLSASQAVIRLNSALPINQLLQSLQSNGFIAEPQSDGRYILHKQNG